MHHARLAGDTVVFDLKSYSSVLRFSAHISEEHDVKIYSQAFHFGPPGSAATPGKIYESPWENQLDAAYSTERQLYVKGPPYQDWGAEMMVRPANSPQKCAGVWRYSRTSRVVPALGASNDGRYLILTDGPRLIDTLTMQEVNDGSLAGMLTTAAKLEPEPDQCYSFTNRLNYLIVLLHSTASDGKSTATIAGKTVNRGHVGVVIGREGKPVGTFPIERVSETEPSWPGERYQDAGESEDGSLLLLYAGPTLQSGRGRITLRNMEMKEQAFIDVDEFSGATYSSSWDPATNRILFYRSRMKTPRSESKAGETECIVWNYKNSTVLRFQAGAFQGFQLSGPTFKPRRE